MTSDFSVTSSSKRFLILVLVFGSVTPSASPPPRPSIVLDYSLLVHHPISLDDQHLLANAMVSDFTVAWQYSQSHRVIVYFEQSLEIYRISPHF
jgi:hypothetical protein